MKLSALKRDRSALDEAVWIDNIPQMGSLRLKVRSGSYPPFVAKQAALLRAIGRQDRGDDGFPTADAQTLATGRAVCEAGLLADWDGLLSDDDKPVSFTAKRAREYLTDLDYAPLLDAVLYAAGRVDFLRAKQQDAMVGNSSPPSGTPSTTTAASVEA